jgi:hypothetical protein
MTHEWFEAVGGLGLNIAAAGGTKVFAGLIREVETTSSRAVKSRRIEIERFGGATEVRPTLAAAKARLLAKLGATAHA